jgi:hypothetical protein
MTCPTPRSLLPFLKGQKSFSLSDSGPATEGSLHFCSKSLTAVLHQALPGAGSLHEVFRSSAGTGGTEEMVSVSCPRCQPTSTQVLCCAQWVPVRLASGTPSTSRFSAI